MQICDFRKFSRSQSIGLQQLPCDRRAACRNSPEAQEMFAGAHQRERVVIDEARFFVSLKLKSSRLPDPSPNRELMQFELRSACILDVDATHILAQQARSITDDSA
jgi:hypothetical protein